MLTSSCAAALCILRPCRRSGGSYGGGYYGGGGFISPVDIWILLDPGYGPYERRRRREEGGMNFLEAIFSFVFGDGDPNETFEERRWRALGQHIQVGGWVSERKRRVCQCVVPLLCHTTCRHRCSNGMPQEQQCYHPFNQGLGSRWVSCMHG